MNYTAHSIRTFIGAKNYDESRQFYRELGWIETVLFENMVVFKVNDDISFYLQKYYVKDWVNNSMVFLEVDDLDACHLDIKERGLVHKYNLVKLSEIKTLDWGREFFMHDPSGVLWHLGSFATSEPS